jgi:hypothetical protein
MKSSAASVFYLFLLSLVCSLFPKASPRPSFAASGLSQQEGEQLLFVMQPGVEVHSAIASPDCNRVAWVVNRKGKGKEKEKWMVVVNGVEGPEFDAIFPPEFTADNFLGYRAERKDRSFVVIEGKEYPAPEGSEKSAFDGEGKIIYYWIKAGKGWSLVFDGKQGPEFDGPVKTSLSPDRKRTAYIGQRKNVPRVVVDGKEGPEYKHINNLSFSPDSKHVVYFATRAGKVFLVIDGQETPAFKAVSEYAYSLDGKRFAYGAKPEKGKWRMIIDNQEGPEFELILALPVFSFDGKHVAYGIWEKDKRRIILDGQQIKEVPGRGGLRSAFLEHFTFSPDGQRLAYVVGDGGPAWSAARQHGEEYRALRRVVVDGPEGKEYDVVAAKNLQFSPDSKHFAYELHDIGKGKSLVVVNGREGKHYDDIVGWSLRFTSDGMVRYVAREGFKIFRVTQRVSPPM